MRKMVRILCVITVLVIALDHAFAESQVDLHLKFSHLESQLKMLTQRLQQDEEMFKQCRDQDQRVSSLQSHVDNLKWQLRNATAMENKKHEIKDVIEKVQRWSTDELSAPNRFSRSADWTQVAFTAEMTHDLNDVPIHTTIRFDHLVTKTGTTFDVSTGIFTSPTSGLYLFSVFIESNTVGTEAVVQLMKEGKPYMSAVSDKSDAGDDVTGGNVCLIIVNEGQRVWIETVTNDKQSFWHSFTTFSGVLIHRH